jgi:hypothetical protein
MTPAVDIKKFMNKPFKKEKIVLKQVKVDVLHILN